MTTANTPISIPIPDIIRRNTIFLAATQACVGVGIQMVPTLGAVMVVRLLGSATFTGLGTGMLGLSRLLIAYPMGALSDRYGRKPGLIAGLLVALVGSLVCGLSMVLLSFPVFLLGQLLFGLGMGALQQLRVAAADMYPASRRAEGLGYLLTGSFLGALGGPAIVGAADALGPGLHLDTLALSWMLIPAVLLPAVVLVFKTHPDPQYIATHMPEFYPGLSIPAPTAAAPAGSQGFRAFLRSYPLVTAFATASAVQGVMAMMMAMTAYTLDHHGHGLSMISVAVALHVMGMFAFSIPLGRLTDRVGHRLPMVVGLLVTGAGSLLIVATSDYWPITIGTVLVGLGWSAATVASTALVTSVAQASDRGRALGASDTFSSAAGIALPLVAGPIVEVLGLPAVGVFGALVMAPPLVMMWWLKGTRPAG